MSKKIKVPKNVQEHLDSDYRERLSNEDKAYFDRFIREYYTASGLKDKDALHTPDMHKKVYRENYVRRNDAVGITKTSGKLSYEQEVANQHEDCNSIEFKLKIMSSQDVMEDVINNALELLDLSKTKEFKSKILKKFALDVQKVLKITKKMKPNRQ
jgi:hypothetical protein